MKRSGTSQKNPKFTENFQKKGELFDAKVWGPHYWFFLHTVAQTYPHTPNSVTKRKYYDLIVNMPLFIPDPDMGDRLAEMIDKHPVTPYLDSRDSLIRWIHYIHNKFNVLIGKEEISLLASLDQYAEEYRPQSVYLSQKMHIHTHYIYMILILILLFFIYVYYE